MSDERKGVPSASGLYRYAACPGSFHAEQGCPEDESAAALSGIVTHAILSGSLGVANFAAHLPRLPSEAEIESARECRDLVLSQFPWLSSDDVPQWKEKRLWLRDDSFRPLFSAKCDLIGLHPDHPIVVIDYKTGWLDFPTAWTSWQITGQVAVVSGDGFFSEQDLERGIIGCIVAPHAPKKVTITELSPDRYLECQKVVLDIQQQLRPDAPRTAGPHCKYCLAKLECETFIATGQAPMDHITVPDPLPLVDKDRAIKAATKATIRNLSQSKLDELLTQVSICRWLCDAAEDEAMLRIALDPEAMPNWKLSRPVSVRTVTNVGRVFQVVSQLGITAEMFSAACKIGVIALEQLVHSALGSGVEGKRTLKNTKQWMEENLADVIVRIPKASSLERR